MRFYLSLSTLCLFTLSSQAFALPTPDTLFSIGHLITLSLTTIFSFLLGAYLYLRKKLSGLTHHQLQTTILLLGSAFFALLAVIIYLFHNSLKDEKLREAQLYFRSDLALDALEAQSKKESSLWKSNGVFLGTVTETDIPSFYEKNNPHLIFVTRSKLSSESGIPGFATPRGNRLFTPLYHAELIPYLKKIGTNDPSSLKRPILFFSIKAFNLWPFSQSKEIAAELKRFGGVYILDGESENKNIRYFVQTGRYSYIETNRDDTVFQLPVRKENWIINQRVVAFPKINVLIPPKECAQLLSDPSVEFVLAFDSKYRPFNQVSYYLGTLFKTFPEINRKIHLVDWNSPNISDLIQHHARSISGKRFVIGGLSKHDWIYMGLDIALRSYQYSPFQFEYLGGCPWLADSATILNQKAADRHLRRKLQLIPKKLFLKTQSVLVAGFDWIQLSSSLPRTLLMGICCLLVTIPVLLLAPSGLKRRHILGLIRKHANENPTDLWLRSSTYRNGLEKYLGVKTSRLTALALAQLFSGLVLYSIGNSINPSPLEDVSLIICISTLLLIRVISQVALPRRAVVYTSIVFMVLFFTVVSNGFSEGGSIFLSGYLLLIQIRELLFKTFEMRQLEILFPRSQSPLNGRTKAGNINQMRNHPWVVLPHSGPLFHIAKGWTLNSPEVPVELKAQKDGSLFIVRSSAEIEDQAISSNAGKFLTLSRLSPKELPVAVTRVFNSFQGAGQVLIQDYISTDLAGVMFTQSIENPGAMQIEWSAHPCSDVVSGRAPVDRYFIGRFSGLGISPLPTSWPKTLAMRLFLISQCLERYFGAPQDIEWGYIKRTDQLYIFQSRPITRFLFSEDLVANQTCLIQAFASRRSPFYTKISKPFIKPASSDEVARDLSALSLDLIGRLYSLDGSLGRGFKEVGIPIPKCELHTVAFGQLLEFTERNWWYGISLKRNWRSSISIPQRIELLEAMLVAFQQKKGNTETPAVLLELLKKALINFIDNFYPQVFAINMEIQFRHSSVRDPRRLHTKLEELNRDLATASSNVIQNKWAHRGPKEYDILSDSYGTDLGLVEEAKRQFRLWDTSSILISDKTNPIVQRERAKDLALQYLHHCRLALLQVQRQLKMSRTVLLQLRLADLLETNPEALIERHNRGQLSGNPNPSFNLKISRPLSFLDVEHLYFERRIQRDDPSSSIFASLKAIGSKKEISGSLYFLNFDTEPKWEKSTIPDGCILVVPFLDPGLAVLFPRISGLVCPRGGSLSHLAILAREQAIPIFVGDDAYGLLKSEVNSWSVTISASGKVHTKDKIDTELKVA